MLGSTIAVPIPPPPPAHFPYVCFLCRVCRYLRDAGVPLVFELDKDLKPICHPEAIPPLSARYLGDVSGIRARIEAVKAQTK